MQNSQLKPNHHTNNWQAENTHSTAWQLRYLHFHWVCTCTRNSLPVNSWSIWWPHSKNWKIQGHWSMLTPLPSSLLCLIAVVIHLNHIVSIYIKALTMRHDSSLFSRRRQHCWTILRIKIWDFWIDRFLLWWRSWKRSRFCRWGYGRKIPKRKAKINFNVVN